MGTTPQEFLEVFASGNYEDFRKHPGCVRRGFNAAVSASHVADHYFEFNRRHSPDRVRGIKDIGAFSEQTARATGDAFRDIRSISNAYKHLYTDTKPHLAAHSTITSSGTIDVVFEGDAEFQDIGTEFHSGGGEDDPGRVIFTRKDGSKGDLLESLTVVMAYWKRLLDPRA
jgi:hypothetical protein